MPPAAAAIGDVRMSDVAGASDGRMAGAGDVGGPGGSEAPANGGGGGGGGGGDGGDGEARPPKGGEGQQAKGGGPPPPPPPHFFLGDDNELHPTPTALAAPRFPPSLRLPLAAGLTPPPPAPPTPPSPPPNWGRPLTPADYRDLRVPAAASVVIDMGSASVRAGFSSDWSPAGGPAFPRLDEPSRVARVRDEATGHRRFAIGAEAMAPATRGISRSPFDGNLPWGATTSERLLDGVLLHLGLAEVPALPHRVLMTEAPAVPNAIRGALAEVLFEAYGAPAVTYAVDGLLSYLYNCNTHRGGSAGRGVFAADAGGGGKLPPLTYSSPDALVVSAGHAASHVLPVAGGRFAASGAVRVDVGGAAVSSTFLRRVQLLHPEDGPSLRSDHAEALIAATAYVSADYEAELAALQGKTRVKRSSLSPSGEGKAKGGRSGGGRGGGKGGGAPSRGTSPGPGSTPTPLPPVPYTEEEAAPLLAALAKATPLRRAVSLRHADEDAFFLYLAHRRLPPPGAVTDALAAAEAEVSEAAAALGAAKAASVTAAHERVVAEDALLATPDADLPAAELKATALPSGKRKRKSSAGGAGAPGAATAGGDDADDTFGANDEDWDVYQQLTSAGSSAAAAAAAAAANARLSELATELADMVSTGELPSTHAAAAAPDDLRPPTGARTLYAPSPVGELRLSVDRVRAPEVLFRPPLLGVDQCGIAEAAALALAPPRAVSLYGGTLDGVRRAAGNLFLTGGPALLPGYARRLVTDMRCRLPAAWGADLVAGVTTAADPLRDAWRGGALWASRGGDAYAAAGVTRAMYDEVGPDYLVEHLTGNRWYATPD
ncbi:hypothetical protein I4F81_003294 [Pyropia yezoensis]|uniref:Uncharacterized protein n=1 Tax=Pyropia yezoensis TaxID=2788 RepID=A0ACC3BTC2_PYRYE|nr:hypothetical protein I4F81_003294 [Neopyropia yezoensis]